MAQAIPSWHEDGVPTLETVRRIERLRLLRATRVADDSSDIGDGVACRLVRSKGGAWANVVVGLGLSRAIERDDIGSVLTWFEEARRQARVEVSDRAHPSVFRHLADFGFRLKAPVAVLAREIDGFSTPSLASGASELADGLQDVRIDISREPSPELCDELARVMVGAFASPEFPMNEDDVRVSAAAIAHPDVVTTTATADGRLIGGGFLDIDNDLAALWGAAVHPDFRRRGVHRALFLRRLHWARQFGARLATVETTPGGPTHRNAARLGFMLITTRLVFVGPDCA